MNKLRILLSSILAGMCISIGGMVFLSVNNIVLGASLFTIGLFTILINNFHLYTGKVCYALERGLPCIFELFVIWIGNFIGVLISSYMFLFSRSATASLVERAISLSELRLTDNPLSLILLSFFCGIMIFIAVNAFDKLEGVGKYVGLILPIMVFILCGFEHSIADMFFFTIANVWKTDGLKGISCILLISVGNAIGGMLFPLLTKMIYRPKSDNKKVKKESLAENALI